MAAGTRSGAGLRAQPPQPESPSSGDDDEEIPNTSQKPRIDPRVRSLDHRRTRSRQSSDNQSPHAGPFKKRRVNSMGGYEAVPVHSTTASPSVAQAAEATTGQNDDREPSPEDVPVGLMNTVMAALKKTQNGGNQQVLGETRIQNEDDLQTESKQADGDIKRPKDQFEADTSRSDRSPSESMNGREEAHIPEPVAADDRETHDNSTEIQRQYDVYEVPLSPEQSRPVEQAELTNSSRSQGKRIKVHLRSSEHAQLPRSNKSNGVKHPQLPEQSEYRDPSVLGQTDGVEADPEQEALENAEDSNASEYDDEANADNKSLPDIDLSTETFAQDVANFRDEYPEGFEDEEEHFEGPPEEDDIVVHIDSSSLDEALLLMSRKASAGTKTDWTSRPFDIDLSEIQLVQTLLRLLAKLERLFKATPRAPRIAEQNAFLNKHSNLLIYYFSKIKPAIESIRGILTGQKSIPPRENIFKYRKTIMKEIALLVIPLLFHVLASAWNFGGIHRHRTSFTVATTELLRRVVAWIGLLYRPFLSELRKHSPASSGNPFDGLSKQPEFTRAKHEELDRILKGLRSTINAAPDALEEEDDRRVLERRKRKQRMERQEEIKLERLREEEERKRSIEERQWRSLMSIRGIHKPFPESSMPSSARESPASQISSRAPQRAPHRIPSLQVPSHISSQASSYALPPRAPSRKLLPEEGEEEEEEKDEEDDDEWTLEEKTYLFKKIQQTYPNLLDLDEVRWELARSLISVEAMTEELLDLMLEAALPKQSLADRNAHIQEVMQNYRRTWSH